MTETRRLHLPASMNRLADNLEAALNGDPAQVRTTALAVIVSLRTLADENAKHDLRYAADILTAALDAEGVAPEVKSRIWNRFMFGAPEGLASR